MVDEQRHRGNLVAALSSAVAHGSGGLRHVPGLLRQVLVDHGWREFVSQRGEEVRPASFEEFVTTPPLKGIGAESVAQIERLVSDDPEALRMVREASTAKPGGDRRSTDYQTKTDNVSNGLAEEHHGNRRSYTLDRLHRQQPDLYQQVVDGQLSANAAAVQAGWRPRTFTVRADDPGHIARTLQRRLDPGSLKELRRLLEDI